MEVFDCSGYATKVGIKCADGKTIMKDAFAADHGKVVPVVWQHRHDDIDNVLGHALLEVRPDGVYAYTKFNEETPQGKMAKELVKHGDLTAYSIFANDLVQKAKTVIHGVIREVSLVLAGANPEAIIDNVLIKHGDDDYQLIANEADIFMMQELSRDPIEFEIRHSDISGESLEHMFPKDATIGDVFNTLNEDQKNAVYTMLAAAVDDSLEHALPKDATIGDVFDTFTEEQKNVVYAILAAALEGNSDSLTQGVLNDNNEGGTNSMKVNAFDQSAIKNNKPAITHDQFKSLINEAVQAKAKFSEVFLAHATDYGIDDAEGYLFPDARSVTNPPDLVTRDMSWVSGVLNGTRHTPFSRIKSLSADLTADEARAKGYIKAVQKTDEVFPVMRRVTTPQTIYKKQKLDRDDILDITDFDVVAFIKAEMRLMLDEEIARAVLIGDGRAADSPDKILQDHVRSIYLDDDFYSLKVSIPAVANEDDMIEAMIRGMVDYEGSGSPVFYTTKQNIIDMLLIKDAVGRRIYNTETELAQVMGFSRIVSDVDAMKAISRVVGAETRDLVGIAVNLRDYIIGADRGGQISSFEDFDIDFNQYKYLMETRISGALTKYHSAVVFEKVRA